MNIEVRGMIDCKGGDCADRSKLVENILFLIFINIQNEIMRGADVIS